MSDEGGADGPAPSPQVLSLEWGEVATEAGTFRDAKLWPGGGRGWDWGETDTHHTPGVQVADVADLLEHDVEVVVLSEGQHGRLQVPDGTIAHLEQAGVAVEVHRTGRAVERYGELVDQGRAVGALLHSTC